MNALKIQKVSMYGFKNHEDLVEFNLGEHTKVYGDNGQGKTTIGEAITWGLLGTDLTGNERATTRLTNHKCKDVYVELKFIFDGKNHTIIRRKKGTSTNIFLDDKAVEQHDLISFYQSKELFLSIFNPSYFPTLAPKDAKAILDSVLGEVDKDDVYKQLSSDVVKVLQDTAFGVPNLYLENKRERLKEIDKEVQYWNGFKEGKQEDLEIPELLDFDEEPLQKLYSKLNEVNAMQITPLHDISELAQQRNVLQNKIHQLNSEIQKIESKPMGLVDTKELELQLSIFRANYRNQQDTLRSLDNKVECPKCKTNIDLDETRKIDIENKLLKLKNEGIALASQLEEIQKNNTNIRLVHEHDIKTAIEFISTQISKFQSEMDNLNLDKLIEENVTHSKRQELEIASKRNALMAQIKEFEQQKQIVVFNNTQRAELLLRQEEMFAKVKDATLSITELGKEKQAVEWHIECTKQFNGKRLQIQAEQIGKHLDKVTIQLQKIIKATGEIKDDFKILYDGKEFAVLSNSERIKAGLEIANLLINVSGLNAPIFVDNAEAITVIPRLNTQMIEARVKENTALTVEVA